MTSVSDGPYLLADDVLDSIFSITEECGISLRVPVPPKCLDKVTEPGKEIRMKERKFHRRQEEEPSYTELYLISLRLRAIGHLVESQAITDPPTDFRDVQTGLGLILFEISLSLRDLSERIESQELRRPGKRSTSTLFRSRSPEKRQGRSSLKEEQL